MVARKSTRATKLKTPYSPVIFRKRKHALNRTKSMKKLAAHTERSMFKIQKKGDNVVITCSAAAYRLIKSALNQQIEISPDYHISDRITETDSTGAQEHNILKISNSQGKVATINFYNTSSRIMVNGERSTELVTSLLERLMNSVQADVDVAELDIMIRKGISDWLILHDSNKSSCEINHTDAKPCVMIEGAESVRKKTNYKELLRLEVKDTYGIEAEEATEELLCTLCNKSTSVDNAVHCALSDHWIHFACSNIDNKIEPAVDFTCPACQDLCNQVDHPLDAIEDTSTNTMPAHGCISAEYQSDSEGNRARLQEGRSTIVVNHSDDYLSPNAPDTSILPQITNYHMYGKPSQHGNSRSNVIPSTDNDLPGKEKMCNLTSDVSRNSSTSTVTMSGPSLVGCSITAANHCEMSSFSHKKTVQTSKYQDMQSINMMTDNQSRTFGVPTPLRTQPMAIKSPIQRLDMPTPWNPRVNNAETPITRPQEIPTIVTNHVGGIMRPSSPRSAITSTCLSKTTTTAITDTCPQTISTSTRTSTKWQQSTPTTTGSQAAIEEIKENLTIFRPCYWKYT